MSYQLALTADVANAPFFIANAGYGQWGERALFWMGASLPSSSTNPVAHHLHEIGAGQAVGLTFTATIVASSDPTLGVPLLDRAQLKEFAKSFVPEAIEIDNTNFKVSDILQ